MRGSFWRCTLLTLMTVSHDEPKRVGFVAPPQSRVVLVARWLELRVLLFLAWSRLTGDEDGIVDGLLELGLISAIFARIDESERAYEEARQRAVRVGYGLGIERGTHGAGTAALHRGDFDKALKVLEPELLRFRQSTDRFWAADYFIKLGIAREKLDRLDAAAAAYSEAEMVASKTRNWRQRASALHNLGGIRFKQEQYEEALRHWKVALSLYEQHHNGQRVAEMQYLVAHAAGWLGLHEEAHDLLAASVDSFKRIGDHEMAKRSAALLAAGYQSPDE